MALPIVLELVDPLVFLVVTVFLLNRFLWTERKQSFAPQVFVVPYRIAVLATTAVQCSVVNVINFGTPLEFF